jgi:hypothetical protein
MTEQEFEFEKCRQIIELEQGRRMSPTEAIFARAVYDYCISHELKQTQQQEHRQRIFQAVGNFQRGKR